ncbi:MAG: TetR/AcrR family transcriptional regulator [Rhodospirillales bacterium]|nr:TetR/AcrR family transcriptional regulator [Rhodospirillales bacterium]
MPRLAPQSRDDRRARILDAAKSCFIRFGFHSASMQQICAAAGMSAGNLYRYFPSKDAIIEGLCERDMNEAADGFAAVRSGPDVLAGLEGMLLEYLWKRPREHLCMWTEISAEATRSDAVNRNSRRVYAFIEKSLAEVLAQGIANGTVRKGVDMPSLAGLMNAVFEGMMVRRAVAPDFDPRPAIRLFMAQLRAALAPSVSTPKKARGARK